MRAETLNFAALLATAVDYGESVGQQRRKEALERRIIGEECLHVGAMQASGHLLTMKKNWHILRANAQA